MNQFIDVVSFEIEAGHGGAGCVSFRKEAHVPMGGPDGGNGGEGGDVYVVVDARINSFGKIKSRRKFRARDGEPGRARLCDGKKGDNVVIKVPVGTVIYDDDTNNILADLVSDGDSFLLARGGKGGKGNKFYATATNQAPDYAQHGLEGESLNIRLEVKLIADIGLVGMPNAGKSSLLARLTRANPKIASYPFTTLTPNLGVCYLDYERSFVIADIPGIIEGASDGAGLGLTFLRHIERTGALVFVLDITEDIIDTYQKLRNELKLYSSELIKKKSIIVLNKIDMIEDYNIIKEKIDSIKKLVEKEYKENKDTYYEIPEVFAISVFTLDGDSLDSVISTFYKANEERYTEIKKNLVEPLLLDSNRKINLDKRISTEVLTSSLFGKYLEISPIPYKTCSYDCIYCELGKEPNTKTSILNYYSVDEIIYELKEQLIVYKNIDNLIISGNGEPTLYKDLKKLVNEIKDIVPIPVTLLTNASLFYIQNMRSSLINFDTVIATVNSYDYDSFRFINNNNENIDFDNVINGLIEFRRIYKNDFYIEIFLLKGINDSNDNLDSIIKIVNKINPDKILLRTAIKEVAYDNAIAVDDIIKIKSYLETKTKIEILIHND